MYTGTTAFELITFTTSQQVFGLQGWGRKMLFPLITHADTYLRGKFSVLAWYHLPVALTHGITEKVTPRISESLRPCNKFDKRAAQTV